MGVKAGDETDAEEDPERSAEHRRDPLVSQGALVAPLAQWLVRVGGELERLRHRTGAVPIPCQHGAGLVARWAKHRPSARSR